MVIYEFCKVYVLLKAGPHELITEKCCFFGISLRLNWNESICKLSRFMYKLLLKRNNLKLKKH